MRDRAGPRTDDSALGLRRKQAHELIQEPRAEQFLPLEIGRGVHQHQLGFRRPNYLEKAMHLVCGEHAGTRVRLIERSQRQEGFHGLTRWKAALDEVGEHHEFGARPRLVRPL